ASPQIRPRVSTKTCRLRPAIFFPAVVALGAAGLGRLDRLAIEDAGAGRRLAVVEEANASPQRGMNVLPDALATPGVEVVGDGLPGREVMGQHHGVAARPAGAAIPLGKQMLDVVPLGVCQITGVTLPCRSIHAQEDNIDWHVRGRLLSRRPLRVCSKS